MSKVINLEVIDVFDGVVVLEDGNNTEIEINSELLPDNIKVGQSLKFVISLNDIRDRTWTENPTKNSDKHNHIPNGKQLAY